MDVAAYLQCFESSLSSYAGDDPLEPWDMFVEYLEQRLPADASSGMSQVFDSLVQRFLDVERYANDARYVNYCIKCANYYPEPMALYSHVYSKGVGTRTAALYVAWAQQFEQKGLNEQADAVYLKAVENQAQPADALLHEYRQFQARTRIQTAASAGRNPLQTSHLTNQMSSHREPAAQSKAAAAAACPPKPPANKSTIIVSRSETSAALSSHNSSTPTISEYMKEELGCEGSELCFEEVRAAKYFQKIRERQEREQRQDRDKMLMEKDQHILNIQSILEKVNQDIEAFGDRTSQPPSQRPFAAAGVNSHPRQPFADAAAGVSSHPWQPFADASAGVNSHPRQPFAGASWHPAQPSSECPRPSHRLSSRRSLGLRLHTEPTFVQEPAVAFEPARHQTLAAVPEQGIESSEVSHHPSLRADGSVQLPQPMQTSEPEPAIQTSVVQRFEQEPLILGAVCQADEPQPGCSWAPGAPEESSSHRDAAQPPPDEEEQLDVSQGGAAHLSHITPNSSLGVVQATPSRALPSPTVNTREALDVIMDMFQAPTFLGDTFSNGSVLHAAGTAADEGHAGNGGASMFTKPAPTAPFAIFQDDHDKENGSAAAAVSSVARKSKPIRALTEITAAKSEKPNETPPDLMPDESTMWGARYNSLHSLAACPNSTTDFAMLAQCVSTPFTRKTPTAGNLLEDQDNNCDGGEADENAFIRRQSKKLSPIIEQSPSDEKLSETAVSRLLPSAATQGTIVGEGLAAAAEHCLTTSSITMVQPPPPAVLSFRDQTLGPSNASMHRTTGPSWEVYTGPEQPPRAASPTAPERDSSAVPRSEPFTIMEDFRNPVSPEKGHQSACDIPMSPDWALKPDWPPIRSPAVTVEPDLDAFLSPCRLKTADTGPAESLDVPMSPEQQQQQQQQRGAVDDPMTSPDRNPRLSTDAAMKPATPRAGPVQLLSDPWDSDLISDLLSTMSPPLTSHPHCITWQRSIPSITPKMTISMGKASLRVDCVLGEGAFATVYQATDPATSEKMVLKVQKPANPWEFYINTQLDARLRPSVRHLYSSIRSAHLFDNGSVLLGELHSHGTLLNAVNVYKTLSDKVMPQPLVMYFAACILHMVEELHAARIIHADVKPDNFMLGQRFLENKCFEPENVDHGLVLIDLGQSIDMELFPEGTAFTTRCLTSGFQCTEMLSGKPWNYQTDYFGIAGTIYCLLFGTYMQVVNHDGVWRTNAVFRRNPHSDLWQELFHALLNVPDCRSPPSLPRLRLQLASVLQQNYSSKLPSLKSRLVVQLLESRKAARR